MLCDTPVVFVRHSLRIGYASSSELQTLFITPLVIIAPSWLLKVLWFILLMLLAVNGLFRLS